MAAGCWIFIGDVGCFWMFFTRTDLVEIRVGKKKTVVRVCTSRIFRFETQNICQNEHSSVPNRLKTGSPRLKQTHIGQFEFHFGVGRLVEMTEKSCGLRYFGT